MEIARVLDNCTLGAGQGARAHTSRPGAIEHLPVVIEVLTDVLPGWYIVGGFNFFNRPHPLGLVNLT